MAKTGNQLLAEALTAAGESSIENIVHSKNIKPKQQALLVRRGYFKRIIKGWYLLDADLSAQKAGESALWSESIWSFIGQYLSSRFSDNYWLSPGASLDLHTENNSMPAQIVVFATDTTSDIVNLPNNMSLVVTNSKTKPVGLIELCGVNIYSLESALAESTPTFFRNNPLSMQVALRNADFNTLADELMRSKNVASIGRMIGAYDALEMRAESKKLETIMSGAGFEGIKAVDPFDTPPVLLGRAIREAASAGRIRIMWQKMRQDVLASFKDCTPEFDFYARPIEETLSVINELYVHDAYNSLSIEGYEVTPELIKRVSTGDWFPETIEKDNKAKDALAARGYYDAFKNVIESITAAYNKEDLNYLIDVGITQWYTSLFSPCVAAGIIDESSLAGYRNRPVYIKLSRHVPPANEQLMDCMIALKECIAEEESYPVKAVLGHFFMGYIHPFVDGNGRTARFLMNYLFSVGGYEWVVIKQKNRNKYLTALESASIDKNIIPFANFILKEMENSAKWVRTT